MYTADLTVVNTGLIMLNADLFLLNACLAAPPVNLILLKIGSVMLLSDLIILKVVLILFSTGFIFTWCKFSHDLGLVLCLM